METVLAQLKNRQIFKVATIYVVCAWPLISIADLVVPALGLPDSVMTLLLKIVIIGFPISLVVAWLINFTSEGMMRAGVGHKEQNPAKANFRTTVAVAGSLTIAIFGTVISQMFVEPVTPPARQSFAGTAISDVIDKQSDFVEEENRSIAILPFVPFSKDPADEFFVDGMVEELLNLLAKIPDLKVAARTSSFSYKGVTNKTIVEIGQELGVDTILEGSFRKNDVANRIRVTAQLIDVSTGAHLWSETYDREYLDVFQIQDDIANAVVDKMKVTLLVQTKDAQVADGTKSIDAMVEYGKGRNELSHRTRPSLEKALQHFESAIEKDENYARAYVGLADANILLNLYGDLPLEVSRAAADEAINKALSINDQLGSAYATRGLLLSPTDTIAAEEAFKQALELNPNYAMTYMWYGSLKKKSGELLQAKQLFEKALELDPKSPVAANNVAWSHYDEGSEHEAMQLFSQIIANDPFYPGAYILAGEILRNRGRLDEAIEMYNRALDVDSLNKGAVYGLVAANIDLGDHAASEHWFAYIEDRPGLMTQAESVSMKARYFASKGQLEQALSYLNKVEFDAENQIMQLSVKSEQALYAGDFAEATITLEELKEIDKGDQGFFFRLSDGELAAHLAYAYQQQNLSEKANELISLNSNFLEEAAVKKANDPSYYYNMALISVLRGDEAEAFNYLQGAIDAGWVQAWRADLEPIFEILRTQERYTLMMGGVAARLANMRIRAKEKNNFLAG